MKGVVFNLLEQVVSEEAGEAAWEHGISESGVDGAYTSLGTYSHEELASPAESLAAQLGVELGRVIERDRHAREIVRRTEELSRYATELEHRDGLEDRGGDSE